MYVRNAWYVIAWDHEVPHDRPFARTVLDEPVVLFRDASGRVAALEDRCVHRHYPLSRGQVTGGRIECGYHGLQFDCSGRCTHIPAQPVIPDNARVRSYPVAEKYHWVWIWMGDPARADEALIPDFRWLDHPQWRHKGTVIPIKGSYRLIIENLLDLTHLAFVHKSTIGNMAAVDAAQMNVKRTDEEVTVSRWMIDTPAPPTYVKAGGFTGHVDRWQFINFRPPCFVRLDVGAMATGTGARELKTDAFANECQLPGGIEMRNLNAITPETAGTCHYFWAQAHNFMIDRPEVTDMLFAQISTAFAEDAAIFEHQQRSMDLRPDAPQLTLMADLGQIQGMRMLDRMIERDRALAPGAQTAATPAAPRSGQPA